MKLYGKEITTKEQARQFAIEWQTYQGTRVMSYRDLIGWQNGFRKLAKKFRLGREFKENGLL